MDTGEDSRGLRKIVDLMRLLSISILAIHFYITCYGAFEAWGLTATITTRIVLQIARIGLFHSVWKPKVAALIFLLISLIAAKGKKEEHIDARKLVAWMFSGLAVYFASAWLLDMHYSGLINSLLYIAFSSTGYLLVLAGGVQLSRLMKNAATPNDIFNSYNESFPQEERLLENEYSVNLPAIYRFRGQVRQSWINFINLFRGLLVAGTPGAGKSYFVIRHIIEQHLRKGFTMFLYDFKYDDLSIIVYNTLLKYRHLYPVSPTFWVIDFDHILHRCNPLFPGSMTDITDAADSSRTIMLDLNREWIKKEGDFFVESPINFVTALMWFLRKYEDGKYCTLPHVIELAQVDYDRLFAVLQQEPEIQVLVNPFISAYQNKAMEQLEGQIASAKIGLARLSSPQLYYVLSGNDFSLDINNPEAPKIVCIGNNPQKQQVYGPVLSLYVSRMIKLVNRKGQLKSSLIFDEFPTILISNIDSLIATARSNKVATTLAVQDFSQLKKNYGAEQAEVVTSIVGNIISGQVTGDTASKLSDIFGKIVQDKTSHAIMSDDTSITKMTQLESAIPVSKISTLSSGEFVGVVADNPEERIALKMFHAEIQNDHEAIGQEIANYKLIPQPRQVSAEEIQENYLSIKKDVERLISRELKKLELAQPQIPKPAKNKPKNKQANKTRASLPKPKQGQSKPAQNEDEKPISM
jgi:hypothetical protein